MMPFPANFLCFCTSNQYLMFMSYVSGCSWHDTFDHFDKKENNKQQHAIPA